MSLHKFCLPQILFGPFLNPLIHICLNFSIYWPHFSNSQVRNWEKLIFWSCFIIKSFSSWQRILYLYLDWEIERYWNFWILSQSFMKLYDFYPLFLLSKSLGYISKQLKVNWYYDSVVQQNICQYFIFKRITLKYF